MKWVLSKTKRDHWQFDNRDLSTLEKWSIADLNSAIELVEKQAKHREDSLKRYPDSTYYFLRSGILYRYVRSSGGHITTKEIKADLPHNQLEQIKGEIKLMRYDQTRRELLFIAKIRKVFGNEYYKMNQGKKKKETFQDYQDVIRLKDENPDLPDKDIFEKIANEKGKTASGVKSNYYTVIYNQHKL